jgi:hypothetical protein
MLYVVLVFLTVFVLFTNINCQIKQLFVKWSTTLCNNENTDAKKIQFGEVPIRNEQNQTTDKNTNDNVADNNVCKTIKKFATCKCHCSCKTVMKVVYGFCSVLLMFLFVYLVAVIVSYTVYIIVYAFYFILWALVTSHTKTSGFLIFFSGGIIFVYNIIWKRRTSFYKELFNLTIDVTWAVTFACRVVVCAVIIGIFNRGLILFISLWHFPEWKFLCICILIIAYFAHYKFCITNDNNKCEREDR